MPEEVKLEQPYSPAKTALKGVGAAALAVAAVAIDAAIAALSEPGASGGTLTSMAVTAAVVGALKALRNWQKNRKRG